MLVVHERRGLVDERVARGHDVEEDREIVTAAGRGARAERGIETTDRAQHVATERHVRARAELARREREERIGLGVRGRVVPAARDPLAEPGPGLDPRLALGLQLGRHDHPGDTADAEVVGEDRVDRAQPVAIDDDVVVGERDDRPVGFEQTAIVCSRETDRVFAHVTKRRVRRLHAGDDPGRVVGRRAVVDDDDLVRRVVEAGERFEAALQHLGSVPGRDDDGDERCVLRVARARRHLGGPVRGVGRVPRLPHEFGDPRSGEATVREHAVDDAERGAAPAGECAHAAVRTAGVVGSGADVGGPVDVDLGDEDRLEGRARRARQPGREAALDVAGPGEDDRLDDAARPPDPAAPAAEQRSGQVAARRRGGGRASGSGARSPGRGRYPRSARSSPSIGLRPDTASGSTRASPERPGRSGARPRRGRRTSRPRAHASRGCTAPSPRSRPGSSRYARDRRESPGSRRRVIAETTCWRR